MKPAYTKLLFAVLLAGAIQASGEDERLKALSEDERVWLEEEVIYIIHPQEREVFLSLATVEERARFVEAFWDRRDPNPATLENEFEIEHYRRLEYAISVLGREAPQPGWKTDRGRYYIILGEPIEIQRYYGSNDIVTTELWLYNGDPKYRLPARFNLLFFKEHDIGDYELYHPFADGPEALLHDGFNLRTNQNLALDRIELISVDLAKATLTIDLSEPTSSMFSARNTIDPSLLQVRPSMSVERNLADIEEYPMKKVNTDYLQGYLRYGDRVSADYSFNYVDSRSVFKLLMGPGGTPFVHYSIELDPQNLTLEANDDETLFYTTLQVSLELRNKQGQLLAITDNVRSLQLTKSQLAQVGSLPFAYRDSFPVLPGEYDVSITLRNRATKQFTVADTELSVPEPSDETQILDMILAAKLEKDFSAADEYKSFWLGGVAIEPVTDPVYALRSTAYVATPVLNGVAEQRMRFSVLSGDERLTEEEVPVALSGTSLVTAEVPLLGLEPGDYVLRGEILDGDGNVMASRDTRLAVSPRSAIPRAGVVLPYSFPANVPGLIDMTLGEQLMARGHIDEAEARLRAAVATENPQLPMAKWKLASVILFKRQADEALAILQPLEADYAVEVEVMEGIGFAHYIKKDYAKALPYLEKAKGLRPADTSLLNALGDCYQNLQQPAKARESFELSLDLDPGQEGVKSRLASLSDGA